MEASVEPVLTIGINKVSHIHLSMLIYAWCQGHCSSFGNNMRWFSIVFFIKELFQMDSLFLERCFCSKMFHCVSSHEKTCYLACTGSVSFTACHEHKELVLTSESCTFLSSQVTAAHGRRFTCALLTPTAFNRNYY